MTDTTKPAAPLFAAKIAAIEAARQCARQGMQDDYQARMKASRVAELRQKSNWPAKHARNVNLELSGEWNTTRQAITAMSGNGFLVALFGGRGNGKTQMAVELIRHVTGNEKSARFATAMEFFMSIKSTYKRDCEKTEADVIKEFRRPALLVLDEIGRRGETDWENNLLFELLNGRYNDKKDTLLLCNLSAAELQASLGPSLISRLNESGGLIQCNWQSFRG